MRELIFLYAAEFQALGIDCVADTDSVLLALVVPIGFVVFD
jgi:hypothetical protein